MRKTLVAVGLIAGLIALVGLQAGLAAQPGKAGAAKPGAERTKMTKKILVVYFSHSGNTREMAKQVQELTGGDIFELIPVASYPAAYRATVDQAKKELEADFKPKLKIQLKDVKAYDVVFVGTPNWWNSVAGPVRTFLSDYDLSGKTVVPFVTHAGSGMGHVAADVERMAPKSAAAAGLAVWGTEAKDSKNKVAAWLRGLKLLKGE